MNKNSSKLAFENKQDPNCRQFSLNCDLGETDKISSASIEHKVMPLIDMANIACGGHAGNAQTMRATLELAKQYNVTPGAHPSYPDSANFGRVSMDLSQAKLKASIEEQITNLLTISQQLQYPIRYVKPHGALYNDMAKQHYIAELIVEGIANINARFDVELALMTISGSIDSVTPLAAQKGVKLIAEAFSDRRYLDNGQLTPRKLESNNTNPAAVLDTEESLFQVMSLLDGYVISDTGKPVKISASTVCVHGDNQAALSTLSTLKMMMASPFTFSRPSPDSLLITLHDGEHQHLLTEVALQLTETNTGQYVCITPAFNTLFIEAKTAQIDTISMINKTICLFKNLLTEQQNKNSTHHTLPICYEIMTSPEYQTYNDIPAISAATGLSSSEITEMHANTKFKVEAIGFLPGFAYMSGLPEQLNIPRKDDPRKSVPQGAVAIANGKSCLYPQSSPGGWNILGLCPTLVFDHKNNSAPLLYSVGDTVSFYPINTNEYLALTKNNESNCELDNLSQPESSLGAAEDTLQSLKVTKCSGNITVQDSGRLNASHLGLSVGGAADKHSFHLANRLIGNNSDANTLEILFGNTQFECLNDVVISITGAKAKVQINDQSVDMWSTLYLKKGDVLTIGYVQKGLRIYLAVQGGILAKQFWNSSATVLKDNIGTQLSQGSVICVDINEQQKSAQSVETKHRSASPDVIPEFSSEITVRFVLSSQFQLFSDQQINAFTSNNFIVSPQSDRMGVRLTTDNENALLAHQIDLESEGLGLGAIQIPPNGEPIVMLVDRQTIGGYPKLGYVVAEDCDKLAQAQANTKVTFKLINHQQAKQERTICA